MSGCPGGSSGKESICQCRKCKRHGFDPWVWEDPLEEGMATHSRILAWGIPWTEEPRGYGPQSDRVPHDWSDLAQHSVCQSCSVAFFIWKHFPTLFQTLLEHRFHSHTALPEKGWWLSSLRRSLTVEQRGRFRLSSPLQTCCPALFCATGFCCISSTSSGHIPRSRVTGSKRKEVFFKDL